MFGEILINRGLTIKEVSEGAGIPRSTIADLNSGRTGIDRMSASNLYKLGRYLGINMEDLYVYCRLPAVESEEEFVRQENERILQYGLKLYVSELSRDNLVETAYAVHDTIRFRKYIEAIRDYHTYRRLEMPRRYLDFVSFPEDCPTWNTT